MNIVFQSLSFVQSHSELHIYRFTWMNHLFQDYQIHHFMLHQKTFIYCKAEYAQFQQIINGALI